VKSSSVANEK